MDNLSQRSGVSPDSAYPTFSFVIHGFGPGPGERPLWARMGQKVTHMVIQVGDYVWSQPFRGKGELYEARPYLSHMLSVPRWWTNVHVELTGENAPFDVLMGASQAIAKRKGQPIRSILRHRRLWPRPAWNCTGPARYLLNAIGIEIQEETPDGVIAEIFAAIQAAPGMGACEQDTDQGSSGLVRSGD